MAKNGKSGTKQVRDGTGPVCQRCGRVTARYVHGPDWKPRPKQAFYYTHWYRCENKHCRTDQINPEEPEAKVWLTKGPAAQQPPLAPPAAPDVAAMESHFQSILEASVYDDVPPWEDVPATKPEDVAASELSEFKPFQLRVTDAWLEEIDNWRRKQKRIPSVAEAIRQLVPIGIAAEDSHK